MKSLANYLRVAVRSAGNTWRPRQKLFCIGANKTGTTSLAAVLEALGYRMAPQIPAERMIDDWAKRDFRRLIPFCRPYDAFQDAPFSLDFTFQAMDASFPDSKFILTIRNSPEEWFDSYTRFTRKLLGGRDEKSRANLATLSYNYKGFFLDSLDLIYGKDTPPFDREVYIRSYQSYNERVEAYFAHQPGKLLVCNLASKDAGDQLARFLNLATGTLAIPHLNSSR